MPLLTDRPDLRYSLHGVTFTAYACSATGARSLAAWRADFAPHTPGQAHTMTEEEVLRVLTGTLRVELDGDALRLAAGDVLLVPADSLLTVSNDGDEPAQAWVATVLGMTATMLDGAAVVPPWSR